MTMNRPRKWRVASSQDDVPPGICKCGRLTEREAWLPKIARFADAGAELLEPYESMGDQNEADAVLFFDEADSLLFKRASTGESCSTSISRNRNALMQKLDRFGGRGRVARSGSRKPRSRTCREAAHPLYPSQRTGTRPSQRRSAISRRRAGNPAVPRRGSA